MEGAFYILYHLATVLAFVEQRVYENAMVGDGDSTLGDLSQSEKIDPHDMRTR
jgi:hypothetical protein